MALFLYQASYTPEAWATQIQNPQDVRDRVQAVAEKLGGKNVGIWYAFGEYDLVAILDYPGNVEVAAAAITVAAGGAIKSARTTPLMSIEDGLKALQTAGEASGLYSPPEA